MQMTVREALDYVEKATGKDFTYTLQEKIYNFLRLLPHHPDEEKWVDGGKVIAVRDYDYGWYACVAVVEDKGKLVVQRIDGDNLDPNPNRVKSNAEALAVLKAIKEVKFASDIDKYWNMSDDHKYWSKMSAMNDDARREVDRLKAKLL